MQTTGYYTRTAIVFHWAIAALILVNIPLGLIAPQLDYGATRLAILRIHVCIGILVLILSFGRAAWRLTHTPPVLPPETRSWVRQASHAAHMVLYVLMFGLPLSGIAMVVAAGTYRVLLGLPMSGRPDFEAAALPGAIHVTSAFILIGLLVVHVSAILLHQLVWKDGLLTRMTWSRSHRAAEIKGFPEQAGAPLAQR
jgi:cytochrome b561